METLSQNGNNKLEKLFIAARNARDTSDADTAIKHYEEISALEPNSWEALFYLVILKTDTIKNSEISNAATSITNCIPKVFELINTVVGDQQIKKECVKEVVDECIKRAKCLAVMSDNFCADINQIYNVSFSLTTALMNSSKKYTNKTESASRYCNIAFILTKCGDSIEQIFGLNDEVYRKLAVQAWKESLALHVAHCEKYKIAVFNDEHIQKQTNKIRKYDESFTLPNVKTTGSRNFIIKFAVIFLLLCAAAVLYGLWIGGLFW